MTRVIRKSATSSSQEVRDLLESLFAIQIMCPSPSLWLVSPWVSDLPILDNRTGAYPLLDSVGMRFITLAEILVDLAGRGCNVIVATRDDPINEAFLARLGRLAENRNVLDMVRIEVVPQDRRLHDKALTGGDFSISGSMNFTFSGALLNEEQVELHVDEAYVAAAQRDLVRAIRRPPTVTIAEEISWPTVEATTWRIIEPQLQSWTGRRGDWLVLPGDGAPEWLLIAADLEGQRTARELVSAFVGPAVGRLSNEMTLGTLRSADGQTKFPVRITTLKAMRPEALIEALERMVLVLGSNPAETTHWPKSPGASHS